ncbi:MAG TPA: DUF5660 family protein [Patescibacteria group bacterium]|jgi:hypothetical protein|nr:DUF5660 family protein [Patescibacteria group bacterium]
MTTKGKQQSKFSDKNSVEAAARDIAGGVVSSVKNDLLENSISTAWKQLLFTNTEKVNEKASQAQAMAGDLQEGQEVSFSQNEKSVQIEAAIDYKSEILHFERKTTQIENGQLNQRVEQIMIELKQLSKSIKQLEVETKDIDMNLVPQKLGKYHENFFEFILSNLRSARIKIEDSTSWLNAIGKKANKKGYWGNAKKHGTSYTLSADRAVSQQVG